VHLLRRLSVRANHQRDRNRQEQIHESDRHDEEVVVTLTFDVRVAISLKRGAQHRPPLGIGVGQ
jgi:hypothetical protein